MQFDAKTPLTELQRRLITSIVDAAAFDGWSDAALRQAADECQVELSLVQHIFPNRPLDLVLAHSSLADAMLVEKLGGQEWFETQKVRDKIKTLIMTRFEIHQMQKEAVRRATSTLAIPLYAGAGTKALYRTCDIMWTLAGDTATDYNRYTKRILLAGVYSSSLLVWLNDQDPDMKATDEFVTRRIENVLSIFGGLARLTSGFSAPTSTA